MKNIYFGDKKLVLREGNKHQNPSLDQLKEFVKEIEKDSESDVIVIDCKNESETLIMLRALFKEIPAAGGLVVNDINQLLFIYRRGKWDLPKGKIEKGEVAEEAALREVKEECGITALDMLKELPSTYHTYEEEDGQDIFKETSWFLMKSDETIFTPQSEEGITRIEWKDKSNLEEVFENTYDSIKDVVDKYLG